MYTKNNHLDFVELCWLSNRIYFILTTPGRVLLVCSLLFISILFQKGWSWWPSAAPDLYILGLVCLWVCWVVCRQRSASLAPVSLPLLRSSFLAPLIIYLVWHWLSHLRSLSPTLWHTIFPLVFGLTGIWRLFEDTHRHFITPLFLRLIMRGFMPSLGVCLGRGRYEEDNNLPSSVSKESGRILAICPIASTFQSVSLVR